MASRWFALQLALLLAGALLQGTTVLADDEGSERPLHVVSTGGSVVLPCPADVRRWTLLQQQDETVVTFDTSAPQEWSNYYCTGAFNDKAGHCKQGVRLNTTHGSPLTVYNSTVDHAGIYRCDYEPPGEDMAEKSLEVTIVTYNALTLHYTPDGAKLISGASESTQVNAGSVLSLSCVYLYTGFTDPGAELVLKHSKGDRKVLQSVAQRSRNSFVSNELTEVAADYVVGESDGDIDVVCVVHQLNSSPPPTRHFGGPKSSAATASGVLSDIVLGALIAAMSLIVISVIVVLVLHCRRKAQKRREQRAESRPAPPPAPPPASAKPRINLAPAQLPGNRSAQNRGGSSPNTGQLYMESLSGNPSGRPLLPSDATQDVVMHAKHRPQPGQRGDQIRRPRAAPPPAPTPTPPRAVSPQQIEEDDDEDDEDPDPVYVNVPDRARRT